jgi:hypothetical protein
VLGKIAPDVGRANVQSSDAMTLGVSFYYHIDLLSNAEDFSLGRQVWEAASGVGNPARGLLIWFTHPAE